MTIAQAFNEIAVAQGGTASKSGSIADAIDALNDALAGSDQAPAQTIEQAVRLMGEHVGSGGGGGAAWGNATEVITNAVAGIQIIITPEIMSGDVPDAYICFDAMSTATSNIASGLYCAIYKEEGETISFILDGDAFTDYEVTQAGYYVFQMPAGSRFGIAVGEL